MLGALFIGVWVMLGVYLGMIVMLDRLYRKRQRKAPPN